MIAHIMERFFSGEPAVGVTDNIACGLIRAAIDAACIVMEDPENYDARAELMWIGTLAHNGLAGCGLGIPGKRDGDWSCHGLEHELSAVDPGITHGAGLAVVFPAWMRYVWQNHPERFLTFGAEVFGIEPVDPESTTYRTSTRKSRPNAPYTTPLRRPSTSSKSSSSPWVCHPPWANSASRRPTSID